VTDRVNASKPFPAQDQRVCRTRYNQWPRMAAVRAQSSFAFEANAQNQSIAAMEKLKIIGWSNELYHAYTIAHGLHSFATVLLPGLYDTTSGSGRLHDIIRVDPLVQHQYRARCLRRLGKGEALVFGQCLASSNF
jgi:hypothetical protein